MNIGVVTENICRKLRTKEPKFEACVDIRVLVNKVSSYDDW